jgi:hypothetical protein
MLNRCVWVVVLGVLGAALSIPAFAQPATFKFDFGPGPVGDGMTRVLSEMVYSESSGFGFEAGASVKAVDRGGDDQVTWDFCTADGPFFFSVAVPEEGNYRVTVTLGDRQAESVTTIKAELRRLRGGHRLEGRQADPRHAAQQKRPVLQGPVRPSGRHPIDGSGPVLRPGRYVEQDAVNWSEESQRDL